VLGRPLREIDWQDVRKRLDAGESVCSIARSMDVSHSLLLKGLR
jgi:transposase-like protein